MEKIKWLSRDTIMQFLTGLLKLFFVSACFYFFLRFFSKSDNRVIHSVETDARDALNTVLAKQQDHHALCALGLAVAATTPATLPVAALLCLPMMQRQLPTAMGQLLVVKYPFLPVNHIDIAGGAQQIVPSNKTASLFLIGGNEYGISVVDYTNPLSMRVICQFAKKTLFDNHFTGGVLHPTQELLFVTAKGNGGLKILNATDQRQITLISELTGFNAYSVTLFGDHLAFVSAEGPSKARIFLVDYSNIANPKLVTPTDIENSYIGPGFLTTGAGSKVVYIGNNTLAFTPGIGAGPNGYRSFCALKINSDASLVLPPVCADNAHLSQFASSPSEVGMAIQNNRAYVSGGNDKTSFFDMIDLSNSNAPKLLRSLLGIRGAKIIVDETTKTAFVGDTKTGVVSVINMNQLVSTDLPELITQWQLGTSINDLTLDWKQRLILVVTDTQLHLIKMQSYLTLPNTPITTLTSSAIPFQNFYDKDIAIQQDGRFIYIPSDGFLNIYQTDSPAKPTALTAYSQSLGTGNYQSVTVSMNEKTNLLVVGVGSINKLLCYDIRSTPRFSSALGDVKINFPTDSFFMTNEVLAVSGDKHVTLVNVSNPNKPQIMSTVTTATNVQALHPHHTQPILYAAGDISADIFNISNNSAPTLLSKIFINDGHDVITNQNDSLLFLADKNSLLIYNITDLSNPVLVNRLTITNSINQLVISADNQLLFAATDQGMAIININDPRQPHFITYFATQNAVLDFVWREDNYLLYFVTKNLLTVAQINLNAYAAVPILANQLTASMPVLKTGELNQGIFTFFMHYGAMTQQVMNNPLIANVTLVEKNGELSLINWLTIDPNTRAFSATPPANLAGETITVRITLHGGFYADVNLPITLGSATTAAPTTQPVTATLTSTAIQASPSPSPAPTNIVTTTNTPNVPTDALSTTLATTNTPSTFAPIATKPDPILSPDVSVVSQQTTLQLSVSDSNKLTVISSEADKTITVKIVLPRSGMGEFMTKKPNNLGSALTEPNGQILTIVGNAEELNTLLSHLRFSPTSLASNDQSIRVFATADGSHWIKSDASLTQFGTNRAPIIQNTTLGNYAIRRNTGFAIDFAPFAQDPNGDSMQWPIRVNGKDGLESQIAFDGTTLRGKFSIEGHYLVELTPTDGYLSSPVSATLTLLVQYTQPTASIPVLPDAYIKVGRPGDINLQLSRVFMGEGLVYDARLENGPLPHNWFIDGGRLFAESPVEANRTVILYATDGLKSANASLLIHFRNLPPVVNKLIPDQHIKALTRVLLEVPIDTIKDGDGDPITYIIQCADGSAVPNWVHPNGRMITVDVPAEMLGKNLTLKVVGSDDDKQVSTFFTLFVDPNHAPIVLEIIRDSIAIAGTLYQYKLPGNAFTDPDGNVLTRTVKKLPNWANDVEGTITGTPSKDDVGITIVEVIADDGLNGKAVQTFQLQVDLSSWDKAWKYLQFILAAGSGAFSAYEGYTHRIEIRNTLASLCGLYTEKNAFRNSVSLPITGSPNPYLHVFRRAKLDPANESELSWEQRLVAKYILSPLSHYWYHRLTLIELKSAHDWVEIIAQTENGKTRHLLIIHPEKCDASEERVVQVTTRAGSILHEVVINPRELSLLKAPESRELCLLVVPPLPSSEEASTIAQQRSNSFGSSDYSSEDTAPKKIASRKPDRQLERQRSGSSSEKSTPRLFQPGSTEEKLTHKVYIWEESNNSKRTKNPLPTNASIGF